MASVRKIETIKALLPTKKRVAAYARVSSGKDAMLHSLSSQISYFSDYIQRKPDWEYVGVYADEALTGTKDERPEFQRMLVDCRAGKLDMVITKSISRFARNTLTLLTTVRELQSLGIVVFFEKEGIYSDRNNGEMILTLLASVAQEESKAVSENCKWRIRNRMKAGEPVSWRFQYGYRINRGRIEIHPEEAAVVRNIYTMYLEGVGCEEIARLLQKQDTSSVRGGVWVAKRVREILKNEKYAGNALLQKFYILDHISKKEVRNYGQLPRYFAKDTHPAIIDKDTFDQVQQKIESNRIINNIEKKPPAYNVFTHKIQCLSCGKFYNRTTCRGIVKWQCTTYLRKGREACQARALPEDILLTLIAEALGLDQFDEEVFKKKINSIAIPAPYTVRFIFNDGHETELEWQPSSRSKSWTAEMRQTAREFTMQQRREKSCPKEEL